MRAAHSECFIQQAKKNNSGFKLKLRTTRVCLPLIGRQGGVYSSHIAGRIVARKKIEREERISIYLFRCSVYFCGKRYYLGSQHRVNRAACRPGLGVKVYCAPTHMASKSRIVWPIPYPASNSPVGAEGGDHIAELLQDEGAMGLGRSNMSET